MSDNLSKAAGAGLQKVQEEALEIAEKVKDNKPLLGMIIGYALTPNEADKARNALIGAGIGYFIEKKVEEDE